MFRVKNTNPCMKIILRRWIPFFSMQHRSNFQSSPAVLCKKPAKHVPDDVPALFDDLRQSKRASLARAITLIESQHPRKKASAGALLGLVSKHTKQRYTKHGEKVLSFRIGLTGPPGSGKSTFIEAFGKMLTAKGHKVAVLAVDPSSNRSGGSLLGDKIRMPELSKDRNAFIRPSPSSGHLGGVTRTTNDAIGLCETAGHDVIIVETMGVGQSEFHVAYMVDMFVLIVAPGGGDVLQGLKKGIIEMVDMVIVNKSDGDLLPKALEMQIGYREALKLHRHRYRAWKPAVFRISSLTKHGIPELWEEMVIFKKGLMESGEFLSNREVQCKNWMWFQIETQLMNVFKNHPNVKSNIADLEQKVKDGAITPGQASDILLNNFIKSDCGTMNSKE